MSLLLSRLYFPFFSSILQDGRDGGVASPESRRLKGLKGGVGDGGEPQRRARHPRDIVQAARLLITRSCMRAPGGRAKGMKGVIRCCRYGRKLKHNHTDVFYGRRGSSGGFMGVVAHKRKSKYEPFVTQAVKKGNKVRKWG